MIAAERREAVLRELRLRGTLNVAEFADRIGVAAVTLRRDLRIMEQDEELQRVHGGARLPRKPAQPAEPQHHVHQLAASFGVGRGRNETAVATIGMVVPTRGYYYTDIIAGATQAASLVDVRLVLAISDYDETEERRLVDRMLAIGVDGLLVTPARPDIATNPLRAMLEASPVPVTVMERMWDFPTGPRIVDSVRSDHPHGARVAVEHLVDLGHRRIGLWSYANPHEEQLRHGFEGAVADLGVESYRPTFDYGHPDWDEATPTANVKRYVAEAAAAGVTGLIIHPDQLALHAVQVADDLGLSIPDDLSVVAYDDEVASLGERALTAVAPPKRAIGLVAVDVCLRAIAHSTPSTSTFPAQRLTLLPELRIRESTGPALDRLSET